MRFTRKKSRIPGDAVCTCGDWFTGGKVALLSCLGKLLLAGFFDADNDTTRTVRTSINQKLAISTPISPVAADAAIRVRLAPNERSSDRKKKIGAYMARCALPDQRSTSSRRKLTASVRVDGVHRT